jgi:phosphoserine phosphatase
MSLEPKVMRQLWRSAQAVCFDVDSTVSPDEGIDVLAAHAGKGQHVARLTAKAMGGSVPFEVAIKERLDLIRPSRDLVESCLRSHPPRLTHGIAELVAALRARGVRIHLVSGGFEPMIMPLAEQLGITAEHVHANALVFDDDGDYAGFAADRPTARSGGKAAVLGRLKRANAYSPLIMVGDGVTDLEARPPADAFIGFGGVVVREKVKAAADWFVTDFRELSDALR